MNWTYGNARAHNWGMVGKVVGAAGRFPVPANPGNGLTKAHSTEGVRT